MWVGGLAGILGEGRWVGYAWVALDADVCFSIIENGVGCSVGKSEEVGLEWILMGLWLVVLLAFFVESTDFEGNWLNPYEQMKKWRMRLCIIAITVVSTVRFFNLWKGGSWSKVCIMSNYFSIFLTFSLNSSEKNEGWLRSISSISLLLSMRMHSSEDSLPSKLNHPIFERFYLSILLNVWKISLFGGKLMKYNGRLSI